ncbi:MAG: hypothetical protein WBS14_00265 [Rhodomicrobium sp.]
MNDLKHQEKHSMKHYACLDVSVKETSIYIRAAAKPFSQSYEWLQVIEVAFDSPKGLDSYQGTITRPAEIVNEQGGP